jgi:hypothetical protein
MGWIKKFRDEGIFMFTDNRFQVRAPGCRTGANRVWVCGMDGWMAYKHGHSIRQRVHVGHEGRAGWWEARVSYACVPYV